MTLPNCPFGFTLGVFKKLQYANEIIATEEPVLSQEKRCSKSITWRRGGAKQNKRNTSNADSRRVRCPMRSQGVTQQGSGLPHKGVRGPLEVWEKAY